MSRETPTPEEYTGAASVDRGSSTDLEVWETGEAFMKSVEKAVAKLEQLGVIGGAHAVIRREELANRIGTLLVGQSLDGVEGDTHWYVTRKNETNFEVTVDDESEDESDVESTEEK